MTSNGDTDDTLIGNNFPIQKYDINILRCNIFSTRLNLRVG